ncbi:MAG TPA: glycine oxidase ThiO [Kiritimatiellia bacterium]|nr:glycine oxidase ThiO [Kiritimatiellia bacterium]
MSKTIAIAGAGIMGRLLALAFHRRGWQVSLFDRDDGSARTSCSWAAVGMLAASGSQGAGQTIAELGAYGIEQWPAWLETLPRPVYYRQNGTLAIAHPKDEHLLDELASNTMSAFYDDRSVSELDSKSISNLEPSLNDRFKRGFYFSREQNIDNRELLNVLGESIRSSGITWHTQTEVSSVSEHEITTARGSDKFEWVVDCRGLGAKSAMPDLHGVRGEMIYLRAPAVKISRPVRIMHPRYCIYIAPRADHVYAIGSTSENIESGSTISVRSTLELLSAAYTVHPGFGDGEVLETVVNFRPALPNQLPLIIPRQGLVSVNGLHRFGFLVAPALCDIVVAFIDNGETHPLSHGIMEEWSL